VARRLTSEFNMTGRFGWVILASAYASCLALTIRSILTLS
jgi:hypothetical protein